MSKENAVKEREKMYNKLKSIDDADIRNLINNYVIEIQLAISEYDVIVYNLFKSQNLLNY